MHNHPLQSTHFSCFWDLENPIHKSFSPVYTREHRFTSFVEKWSKLVQDKWPKGRVALVTEKTKHILAPLGGNPAAISPIFLAQVRTVDPHLYSRIHPDKFGFGEVITKKPLHDPQSKCNFGSSSL